MIDWNLVLAKPVNVGAVQMFATGEFSCKNVEKVLRVVTENKEESGAIRGLIRNNGTQMARRITRKALKRRNLL